MKIEAKRSVAVGVYVGTASQVATGCYEPVAGLRRRVIGSLASRIIVGLR